MPYLEDKLFKELNMEHIITCAVHGEVESLLNGKCVRCRDENIANESMNGYRIMLENKKKDSNIPERYLNASLDNYLITNNYQEEIIRQLKSWDRSHNILLLGNVGNGKTYLSVALLEIVLKHGNTGYYTKFFDLPGIQINNKELFKKIQNRYLLIIDEYGRSSSDYKSSLLFELLDKRYDEMLPTIIISNLRVTEFKNSLDPALYSRLKENCQYYNFNWEDFRLRGNTK